MSKKLEITLKRSMIGRKSDQRRTVEALGLRKLHQTVIQPDNPAIRGMLRKIDFLVEVKENEA